MTTTCFLNNSRLYILTITTVVLLLCSLLQLRRDEDLMRYRNIPSSGSISVRAKDIKTDEYSLAEIQSFGLIDDVPDKAWQMLQARVRNRVNHKYPSDPYFNSHSTKVEPHRWHQENFEPDFTCLHEERVGGMGDGPKWVW